jgi:DNA-directed RNA polymerase specialized sigma24 family protein
MTSKLHRVELPPLTGTGKGRVYLNKVIDRCLIDFLRRICAARRDYRRRDSIHRLVREDGGAVVELGSTLAEDAHQMRLSHEFRSEQEKFEASLDLETMLSWLPPDLRDLARRLIDQTPTEISRDTGVPVTTIQYRVQKIRAIFRRCLREK